MGIKNKLIAALVKIVAEKPERERKFKGKFSSNSNPIINKIEKREIDKELGTMLRDEASKESSVYAEVVEYLTSNPNNYGKLINDAEKNGIGYYEKDFEIPITKEALKNVSDDYIIHSILYSSVYGQKQIDKAACEYAFSRLENPIKSYIGYCGVSAIFSLAACTFESNAMKQKMRNWFFDLSPDDQENVKLDWEGVIPDHSLICYLNDD